MCDVFSTQDALKLLEGKSILFLGDSIMRNIYKDLIWLTNIRGDESGYTPTDGMRNKGEEEFCGDRLLNIINGIGRDYEEKRIFYLADYDIRFVFGFITRCYSTKVQTLIDDFPAQFGRYPDIIMMNGGLWDINRWGFDGIQKFRDNITALMKHLKHALIESPNTQGI